MKKKDYRKTQEVKARDKYVGAEIDTADDNRETEHAMKQDTCILNNNPRNNDL